MKNITIRMEDDIHKKLKMKMVMEDKTIQDHILYLIEEDLKNEKKDK